MAASERSRGSSGGPVRCLHQQQQPCAARALMECGCRQRPPRQTASCWTRPGSSGTAAPGVTATRRSCWSRACRPLQPRSPQGLQATCRQVLQGAAFRAPHLGTGKVLSRQPAGLLAKLCLQLLVNLATDSQAGSAAVWQAAFPSCVAAVALALRGARLPPGAQLVAHAGRGRSACTTADDLLAPFCRLLLLATQASAELAGAAVASHGVVCILCVVSHQSAEEQVLSASSLARQACPS